MAKPNKNSGYRPGRQFYYVIYLDHEQPDGKKRQNLGPYSKDQAMSIMTDRLAEGYCAWVEKNYVKNSFRRDNRKEI